AFRDHLAAGWASRDDQLGVAPRRGRARTAAGYAHEGRAPPSSRVPVNNKRGSVEAAAQVRVISEPRSDSKHVAAGNGGDDEARVERVDGRWRCAGGVGESCGEQDREPL